MNWATGETWFDFQQEQDILSFLNYQSELVPTQSHIQWVSGDFFPEGKVVKLTTHLSLQLSLGMHGAMLPFSCMPFSIVLKKFGGNINILHLTVVVFIMKATNKGRGHN
jgi:hypothetical protein